MPFPGTSTLAYTFTGGLQSQVAEFTLDQPYLLQAVNVRYNQFGQLDTRPGLTYLSRNIMGGGTISLGVSVTVFNDELICFDGQYVYSYQQEEQVWINKGSAFCTQNQQYRILNTKVANQQNPDVTSSSNISVYAYEDTRAINGQLQGVRYAVVNNATNTIIVSDTAIYATGTRPKVITDGVNFYLIYNATNFNILYDTIPVNRPNLITSQYNQICSDGYSSTSGNSIAYDSIIYDGYLLTAYAGATGLKLTSTYPFNTLLNTDAGVNAVALCSDSEGHVWVAASDATSTYVLCYTLVNSTLSLVAGPIKLPVSNNPALGNIGTSSTIGMCENNSPGSLNISVEIANGFNNYVNNYVVQTNGSVNYMGQIRGVGLASKPYNANGNVFINTVYNSSLQSTYFTQCLTHANFPVIGKHNPTNGGAYRSNNMLSQSDSMAINTFLFAGQRKGPFTSYQNAQTVNYGVAGYSSNFSPPNAFGSVTSNNNLHIVGGVKKIYDGISVVEDNFHLFPELADGYGCDISLQSGIGNLTYSALNTSLYQWVVTYEWADNYLQVQRSGPSVANQAIPPGAGYGAILTFPTLRLTDKDNPRSPVSINIYRTIANGSIFYKITNDENPIVNDPTVDTLTYTDTLSDGAIQANETLYTATQLPNSAPPACSLISEYQTRLMINSTEDINVVQYSQNKFEQDQYNTLPLDWNTSFVEGVDSKLGSPNGITAIGLLDSSLAIFKERSIFILQGDGPNALDTSGQFNDAQLLVADCGCSTPRSLVFITQTPKLPGGLLFKSDKGIYLLGRDQALYPIGKPVQQYDYLTITSANLSSNTNEVIFTSLQGICLVYNYFFDAWSTWESLPAVAGTIWNNQLVIITPNGTVMVQNNTSPTYADTFSNNQVSPVEMTIETPWIKMNGSQNLQGRMVVYNALILGTLQAPHQLQVSVAYDYNPSVIDPPAIINSSVAGNRWGSLPTWGNPGIWGDNQFSNYQYQVNMGHPRGSQGVGCQSIKLTLQTIATQPSAGYSLNALNLEVMPLGGNFIPPTGNLSSA